MKIALIGASGFVGNTVLNELLNRGHEVTAIARNVDKLGLDSSNLTKVPADVYDTARLAQVLKGHDAVINTFNSGWNNPNIYDDFLRGSGSIQEATKQAGVKRILTVGGAGSLYIDGQQLVDSPGFPEAFKAGALAARDYLNELRKEAVLDWTFLSPAIEMHHGIERKRTGAYRSGLENPVFNDEQRSWITVDDLAVAIVDEIENPKHIRQRFTVAY
ncbi:histidine kinase [Chitinophaga caeni]|uniref:Histidine kinase n=1 Tax=Chitinophaga caeni TaxID=2029983 RepID=A0A291QWE7_9BACT|nr:NAD(P)-dependent oxidoreductase [Chitinophaga caeni]ATL48359.1 histidine kinase [Chitinophaga caeni]